MEKKDLKEQLSQILENSHLLKTVETICLNKDKNISITELRSLTADEIKTLINGNNFSPSWESILVDKSFTTEFIKNSRFYGKCILGKFTGEPVHAGNTLFPCTGIYNSIIDNSEIGSNALIESCGLISNYTISGGAVLFHVNSITASKQFSAGSWGTINIGPETGERSIDYFCEITLDILNEITGSNYSRETYDRFIKAYSEDCSLKSGFIGKKCLIQNTLLISDSFIDDGTIISGTGIIERTTILNTGETDTRIGFGVEIKDSCIQQGCEISSTALIHNSVIMEHSTCEKKCIISSSIIGPGSSIGEAEITSSFTGPLTAAHHHSLLISAIWPGGKGNLGYGANVGSNHTSRQPDQEIFPGEGMFFGLGSNIKFPADYRKAPYSIISTGVITMPQKVLFPFSLINQPSAIYSEVSPSINEIFPAWGLYRNIYAIIRNELKYINRNRSGQNRTDLEIFRPEIIDMMISSASALEKINITKEIYTSSNIQGLGKNFMTESSRLKAIKAYNFHITFYALKHLAQRVAKIIGDNSNFDPETIYKDDDETAYWAHAAEVIDSLGLKNIPLKEALDKYIYYINILNENVFESRNRDRTRGETIIEDYADFHQSPENDPVITELKAKYEIERSRLLQIIKLI